MRVSLISVVPSIWASGLPIIPADIRGKLTRFLVLGIILTPLIGVWILVSLLLLLRVPSLVRIGITLIRIILLVWRRVLLILDGLTVIAIGWLWEGLRRRRRRRVCQGSRAPLGSVIWIKSLMVIW